MPEQLPPRTDPAPPFPRGRRILVVEDEYTVAEDLREALEDLGAEVLGPAPTVQAALALVEGDAPLDAAILDVNLGGETVFPVAEALRARGIPFLFATGYDLWALPSAYADVPRCEKPFDVAQCLRALLGAIAEARETAGSRPRGRAGG